MNVCIMSQHQARANKDIRWCININITWICIRLLVNTSLYQLHDMFALCHNTGQGPTRAQDFRRTELDEGCLASRQFQVPDWPLMETFMVQVKLT
jgi:hypothetical protein